MFTLPTSELYRMYLGMCNSHVRIINQYNKGLYLKSEARMRDPRYVSSGISELIK